MLNGLKLDNWLFFLIGMFLGYILKIKNLHQHAISIDHGIEGRSEGFFKKAICNTHVSAYVYEMVFLMPLQDCP